MLGYRSGEGPFCNFFATRSGKYIFVISHCSRLYSEPAISVFKWILKINLDNKHVSCVKKFTGHDSIDINYTYVYIFPYADAITDEQIAEWKTKFYSCKKNILAQNVCSRIDPFDACISRQSIENTQHIFVHKVHTTNLEIKH